MPKRVLLPDDACTEGVRALRIEASRRPYHDLSQRIGVPISTLDQWIREVRTPTPRSRAHLWKALGINPALWDVARPSR